MRLDLDGAELAAPTWPAGVGLRTFRPEDAAAVHALFEHGYRRGGGSVAPFATWLEATTTDDEFESSLFFLAESGGELTGAALCWTSAFVKDLVVHETWRRRGLGEALLRHVFATFAARGSPAVDLKVQSDNDAAVRLYERLGMRVVERLAAG
jgi:ribosomal protein S18 acetylase RimI-like enzyme